MYTQLGMIAQCQADLDPIQSPQATQSHKSLDSNAVLAWTVTGTCMQMCVLGTAACCTQVNAVQAALMTDALGSRVQGQAVP